MQWGERGGRAPFSPSPLRDESAVLQEALYRWGRITARSGGGSGSFGHQTRGAPRRAAPCVDVWPKPGAVHPRGRPRGAGRSSQPRLLPGASFHPGANRDMWKL